MDRALNSQRHLRMLSVFANLLLVSVLLVSDRLGTKCTVAVQM
jgi:hypothetical protein